MNRFLALWRDERAAMLSSELILVGTILVLGILVGMTTYRNVIVQELGDTAAAAASLNQGFSYDDVFIEDALGTFAYNAIDWDFGVYGSSFQDTLDVGDDVVMDPPGLAPMCISLASPATPEQP